MKKWMLFREEHTNLHFLWNGQYPIIVTPFAADAWNEDGTTTEQERIILSEACDNKRRQVFQISGRCRYVVITRGEFQEP